MRKFGITRRVDELGRIVIPKAIRTNFKIHHGDVLEIFIQDNKIVLQKFNMIGNLNDSLSGLLVLIAKTINANIIITDTDKYIFTFGEEYKGLLNKEISSEIYDLINKRSKLKLNNYTFLNTKVNFLFEPIILNGDILGSIIFIFKKAEIRQKDEEICSIVNKLFINHLEF